MSWIDRLQPSISLTSPDGDLFEPQWIGNERSREKKLGIFTYPNVPGSLVQDLDVNSTKYPLTLYFSGTDNDKESDRFFRALEQKGTWQVEHPVRGKLTLQPMSFSENIMPISSGNVTVINSEWIEPLDESVFVSAVEMQSNIDSAVVEANEKALEEFVEKVSEVSGTARTAINNAASKIKGIVDRVLGPLAQLNDSITSSFNSISATIDSTITAVILAPAELAGQIQNLIQLPGNIIESTTEKFSSYSDLIDEIYNVDGNTAETFAVKDLAISSILSAVASISSGTDANSRVEIISQVEFVSELFDNSINNLDSDMDKVATDKIENQYISQEGTFPQNLLVSSLAVSYLLNASFDLSIEKRFTINEYTLPIFICIEEYGTDELLDFFYETNKITGSDFLLLSPGTEIIVYPGITP